MVFFCIAFGKTFYKSWFKSQSKLPHTDILFIIQNCLDIDFTIPNGP